jgi:hypothetical protein
MDGIAGFASARIQKGIAEEVRSHRAARHIRQITTASHTIERKKLDSPLRWTMPGQTVRNRDGVANPEVLDPRHTGILQQRWGMPWDDSRPPLAQVASPTAHTAFQVISPRPSNFAGGHPRGLPIC